MMNKFICECCKKSFDSLWTEKECLIEKKEIFGDMPLSNMAKVCDDCYQAIMVYAMENGLHPIKKINDV